MTQQQITKLAEDIMRQVGVKADITASAYIQIEMAVKTELHRTLSESQPPAEVRSEKFLVKLNDSESTAGLESSINSRLNNMSPSLPMQTDATAFTPPTAEPSAQREMPRYQCHKKVWALRIKDVVIPENGDGSAIITPSNDGYGAFVVDREYVQKHKPQVGGFYVVYEDGYKSFSPGDAFEAGYTRI